MRIIANKKKSIFVLLVAIVMVFICFSGSVLAQVVDFSHNDDNPFSPRYNTSVGPYDGVNGGTVTMWYHQYNEY